MTGRGRTRGDTARAALRRVGGGVSRKPRTAAHTGADGAASEGLVAVADLLALLAQDCRRAAKDGESAEDCLAEIRDRLTDVDGQPDRLKPMPTTQDPPKNDTAPDDALLTAQDLAAVLGCDLRTLRRWRHEGRIPEPVRIGGALRWRRCAVDTWLERDGAQ